MRQVSPDLVTGASRTNAAPTDQPVKLSIYLPRATAWGHRTPMMKTNMNMFPHSRQL